MGKFPEEVVEAAWKRSNSVCECKFDHSWHPNQRCPQTVIKYQRGDDSKKTGWEAHHIDRNGSDTLNNCLIMCIRCHKETRTYGHPKK